YDLTSIRLVPSSAAAMTAVLDRAIRNQAWVVVTGWEPHWMFARYDLRFLQDPEDVLGGHEQVHVIVRDGFERDFAPEVASFLARLHLPREDLAHMLLRSQEVGVPRAVDDYLQSHPSRVRYWVTGQLDGG
ncbi:MAG: glycine betaine ABC transporter substrate-binding protein, partial [Myxococcota bacterium]